MLWCAQLLTESRKASNMQLVFLIWHIILKSDPLTPQVLEAGCDGTRLQFLEYDPDWITPKAIPNGWEVATEATELIPQCFPNDPRQLRNKANYGELDFALVSSDPELPRSWLRIGLNLIPGRLIWLSLRFAFVYFEATRFSPPLWEAQYGVIGLPHSSSSGW